MLIQLIFSEIFLEGTILPSKKKFQFVLFFCSLPVFLYSENKSLIFWISANLNLRYFAHRRLLLAEHFPDRLKKHCGVLKYVKFFKCITCFTFYIIKSSSAKNSIKPFYLESQLGITTQKI